ncbi:hypothetical protein ACA910_018137 [Epithemia clementina (nom. ined.)]
MLRAVLLLLTASANIVGSWGEPLAESNHGTSVAGAAVVLSDNLSIPDDGLVRLKLIPFHAQRERRRRERQLRRLQGVEEDVISDREFDQVLAAHKDRPEQYARRRRAQQQVAELFQGYGTHYVDLWMGTPQPQRQTVIVDTGSGVTAFPCKGCSNCGVPKYHSDGLFDQDQSTTFRKLSCNECLRGSCSGNECRIHMSYQEGSSWSAFESEDQCYAGGLHSKSVSLDPAANNDDLNPFLAAKFAFPLKFGCQISLTGLFITQLADGIMGLDNAQASYVRQMSDSGIIASNSFSLCYWRQDEIDTDGTESGAFTMGGTDERLHNTPMVFTSAGVGGGGFYGVQVQNIYLRAGNSGISAQSSDPKAKVAPIGLPSSSLQHGRVIVDSGTTDTYFSRTVGTKFLDAYKTMSGVDLDHNKKTMTLEQIQALPTILIQLEGDEVRNKKIRDSFGKPVPGLAEEVDPTRPYDVLLAIPPTHYMEYDPDEAAWTNRFYTSEPSGGVIGGNAMMGHDVFFDAENQQIGWSESDCDYTALMDKFKFVPGVAPSREENQQQNAAPKPQPTPAPFKIEPVPAAPEMEVTTEKEGVPNEPDDDAAEQDDDAMEGDDVVEMQDDAVDVSEDELIDAEEDMSSQFCSSMTCQGVLVSTVLLVVALVALRALKRSKGPAYELSPDAVTELELQDSAGNVGSDGIIRYRDEPVGTP